MEPIMHQGYINLLVIVLAISGHTIYSLVRKNRLLQSIVWEIKKSHDPMREHESMSTDEFWEMLQKVNIDLKVVNLENNGRRDHVN